ncbi:MAG: hypothetical protein LBI03_07715 [Clostridiales bacterium]|jgi:hypothetical protein|nr:hypothetical protein [Clostridiales bacterium]
MGNYIESAEDIREIKSLHDYPKLKSKLSHQALICAEKIIKQHKCGKCICDCTEGGLGLCEAGRFLEGCSDVDDFIEYIKMLMEGV